MKFIKKIIKLFILCCIVFFIANIGLYIYCLSTPKLDITKNQSYYLYDNKGELIFNNSEWIKLEDISPYLIDATIATEDKHFYHHIGFDYIRIIKAGINNITTGSLSEGASTITQQYARNMYLSYEKTWTRKLEEALLAFELETHYTKDEILEGYLNTINYGGVFGIENAANYYFNKSAKDLTLSEASMLAGIPQSPSNNSPFFNEENALIRQNVVLTLMVNNKDISEEEKEQALNEELVYDKNDINRKTSSGRLYYKDAVLEELKTIENIPDSILKTGGIKIYTSLDSEAQDSLENSVNSQEYNSLQVAGIMMNPDTGGIIAMVGGVNYNDSQYNRAIKSKRQVGSTMKPLLYYSALENGFTSASSFISERTTFTFSNNIKYSPKNYNDKYANGSLSMGAAIAYSDNVYAVKTHLFLGENNLVSFANRVGISSKLDALPSLALGTGEISLLDMVSAYSTFANMGYKVDSHLIEKIVDNNDNILYEYKNEKTSLLNESMVYILNEMLTYTYDTKFIDYNYPTLINLLPKMTKKYSIKSGTTDTDMLIIGYNKQAVLGIWTGYDDNKKIESGTNSIHKNIWIDTMEEYLRDKEQINYDIPSNVVGVMVNPITGEIADKDDKNSKMFYFLKGTEPTINNDYDLDEVFKEEYNE